MAQIRVFICALPRNLPVSVSTRVAREWSHSAGLAGSGELLPSPEGRDLAVPRRARARPPGRPSPPGGMWGLWGLQYQHA